MRNTTRKKNPFCFGQVVEKEAYCPRAALEGTLRRRIERGQNTVVLGNRRVGKTSLIWKVATSRKSWKTWYVDFLGIKSGEDFLTRCIQAMGALDRHAPVLDRLLKAIPRLTISVSPDPVTGMPSLTPSLSADDSRPENLVGFFSVVKDLAAKRRLLVIFDEFQEAAQIPDGNAFLSVLRGQIQFMGSTPFVFAGSVRNEMWQLFADEREPLYKSADFVDVTADDFDDFPGFLESRFQAGGKTVEKDLLPEALRICDGVPGDVQQLCAALWDTAPARKVTTAHLGPAIEDIFRNESRAYEAIVTELTAQQLKVLAVLAKRGGQSVLGKEFLLATGITHPSSVKRALNRLRQRRLIFRNPKRYVFSNPFLKLWLLHKGYA